MHFQTLPWSRSPAQTLVDWQIASITFVVSWYICSCKLWQHLGSGTCPIACWESMSHEALWRGNGCENIKTHMTVSYFSSSMRLIVQTEMFCFARAWNMLQKIHSLKLAWAMRFSWPLHLTKTLCPTHSLCNPWHFLSCNNSYPLHFLCLFALIGKHLAGENMVEAHQWVGRLSPAEFFQIRAMQEKKRGQILDYWERAPETVCCALNMLPLSGGKRGVYCTDA